MVKIMHKFVFLYFLVFLLVFSYLNIRVDAEENKNIVFIDPGHGGLDGGCNFKDLVEQLISITNENIRKFLMKFVKFAQASPLFFDVCRREIRNPGLVGQECRRAVERHGTEGAIHHHGTARAQTIDL